MQDTTRMKRLAAYLSRHRRHLAFLGVPFLTATALSIGLAPPVLWLVIGSQVVLLYWATNLTPPLSWTSSTSRHAVAQTREQLEAGFAVHGSGTHSAALAAHLDNVERLTAQHGDRFMRALSENLALKLGSVLREQDGYCVINTTRFGVALFPQRGMDLGSVLAIAQRIQGRLAMPFRFEGVAVWPSVSIGFCLSPRAAALNGIGMLDAAEQAAIKAQTAGPGGLRSYSVADFPAAMSGDHISTLQNALESGEICAFFQPQVRTTTGQVSGLEALARWNHPDRGLISPGEFLPQIEAAGLSPKLAECMLKDAMAILTSLDAIGQHVPTVSVNLSAEELRSPRLADQIAWDLDRCDLTPDRLTLEILETVVADSDDDIAVRNIARLASMGCGIDLDDFGTGHASIANIRRFAVGRIKIDRSFVTKMHEDDDQRRMVAAILSMAEQLELGTVAEGVECAEEQVMLAQMGCDHLQGFAIARPMPSEHLGDWLKAHEAALSCGEPWCEDPAHVRTAASGTP